MHFRTIHKMIPPKRLLTMLAVFSILLQAIIISYNHLSGYYEIKGLSDYMLRLVYNSILTFAGSVIVAYADLTVIRFLNTRLLWKDAAVSRVVVQLILTLVIAAVIAVIITFTANSINPYTSKLKAVIVDNVLILSIINILLMITLEAWIFFIEGNRSARKAELLEKELIKIRFETLKNQLNPHFMFNSLNVLSGLINRDTKKAQKFIDEFSLIYRYALETLEKQVVSLKDELEFVKSYIYLQELRYGENLQFDITLNADLSEYLVPPLSLQVLAENAIKHNIINKDKPLAISIYSENKCIVVRNNYQLKQNIRPGKGIGQENLAKRYAMISDMKPEFIIKNNYYIAKIPLIEYE